MTTLNPNFNPNLSIHLTDNTLLPLLSSSTSTASTSKSNNSSQTQSQSASLTSLTSTAINAYDTSLRLKFGQTQRIIIESTSDGPILLHSFLNPTSSPSKKNCRKPHHPVMDALNGIGSIRGREILSAAREEMRPLSGTTEDSQSQDQSHSTEPDDDEEEEATPDEGNEAAPPLLVGTVVVRTAEDMGEARRAAQKVERVGSDFQREWSRGRETQTEGRRDDTLGGG